MADDLESDILATAEDIAADRSYPFIVFRESDGAMIGGVTLANVRRGIVQALSECAETFGANWAASRLSSLGGEFDADTKTGQLGLRNGTRCMYGSTPLTAASVAALAKLTRDSELALTALVARAIERLLVAGSVEAVEVVCTKAHGRVTSTRASR